MNQNTTIVLLLVLIAVGGFILFREKVPRNQETYTAPPSTYPSIQSSSTVDISATSTQ